jgi:YebC/PmpR family DNA-binding regulatory protein
MSGHSKWSKIKRQKGANDTKRGALFTKIAKAITIVASQGGGDMDSNFSLRLLVDKAKQANMPLVNVEKAIKRGTGEIQGGLVTQVNYEGVGPKGSAFIIVCNSDNTNRTVAEIRNIFENAGGSLQSSGTTLWKFSELGAIEIKAQKIKKSEKFGKDDEYVDIDKEELQLELMEVDGVFDIVLAQEEEDFDILIYSLRDKLAQVLRYIESLGLRIISAGLRFVPKELIVLQENEQEKVLKLMDALDEHDDVESIYCDVNLD